MFRFSCFHAHVHGNKPKKTVQPSTEAIAKGWQDSSQNQVSTDSSPTSSNPLFMKAQEHKEMNNFKTHSSNLPSVERICRSEDLNSKFSIECNTEVCQTRRIKKSQSLESGLYQEGRLYTDNLTEGDADPGFSSNVSKSRNESTNSISGKDQEANPTDQCKKNPNSQFQVSSGLANDCSIFSIGDPTPSDKDAHEISDAPLSYELAGDYADHTSGSVTPTLMKSCSLPDIRPSSLSPGKYALKHPSSSSSSLSRSSDDLQALGMRKKDVSINESYDQIREEQERENDMVKAEESHIDSSIDDGFDSYLPSGLAKDWVMPVIDDECGVKRLKGESSVGSMGELHKKDFKIKRIEDWVIGLQHCDPLEETNVLPESVDPLVVDANVRNGVTFARVDGKVTPGMEAAKRYISSLNANATVAQLANHGLVVIPFLSAFASLKVLNLSGNAIVRITAGALPRGLHMLNLSKNGISTIEGLRELTRLRVLDLSYNRILRIGHGLASCSSLKELYLAGNKISEVEGLHRLLKLSILDLCCNKISTAKCLGQLAANYNSLQAISLEGNPCQKNVGDEQLRKYLQGLLPHLAYYNRQHMKVSTLKDSAERSVRLGGSSHQFDRSLRTDRKTLRKSSHGVAPRRSSTASPHAHRNQTSDLPKLPKVEQGHLPPIRSRVLTQSRYHLDVANASKALNLTPGHFIRKSRSEGTLGAL